jgi:uncharacterized protein with HEPN domain
MPNNKRDLSYIWDMRTAAQEILEFMQGVSQSEFERNNQLRYAVERQLMVIGEAARHVSDEFQNEYLKYPGRRSLANAMYLHMIMVKFWLNAFG